MRVVGSKPEIFDVAFAVEVLKQHKAYGDVFRPEVAPNIGVNVGVPKILPMSVIEALDSSKQVGGLARLPACAWGAPGGNA